MGQCVNRLSKGLVHVNLSHCGLSSKGVNNMSGAFCANPTNLNTLTYLNLSGNSLKDDISVSSLYLHNFLSLSGGFLLQNLHNFLSQSNALQHLDISSTEIVLENVSIS